MDSSIKLTQAEETSILAKDTIRHSKINRSPHLAKANMEHWTVAKAGLRYGVEILNQVITFRLTGAADEGSSDADCAGLRD